jgi:hypothetical protein
MNTARLARFGFVGLICSLGLTLSLFAQTTGNWHTFTDPTGRFSALMPGEPAHQTQKDETHKEGPIVTDTYLVKALPKLYIAGLTQYPQAVALPDQDELNADRDNFNKSVSATLVSEDRKTFAGFPALEFKSKNERTTFHMLVVKADHNVYSMVSAYENGDEPLECSKFVNSLKLIKP